MTIYNKKKPVPRENKDRLDEWKDFIQANINSCRNSEHCLQCQTLINLFIVKFSKEIPLHIVTELGDMFINRLDSKFKSLEDPFEEEKEKRMGQLN